jgi:Zn-dependent protease with chaperone function
MPFLLLLLLTLVCLPEPQERSAPPDWLGTEGCVVLTWLNVLIVAGVAAFVGMRARRTLLRQPALRDEFLHRYPRWRFYHLVGLIAVYGTALFLFGWGRVASFPLGEARGVIPGAEVLVLAPFLAGLVLSWALFYDAEKALYDSGPLSAMGQPFWGRSSYLIFHIRQNLALVMVPVLLVIVVKHLPRFLPQGADESQQIGTIAAGLGALLVLATMPWMMRLVLGLKPLPAGPLAERLLAASRRLKFRCSGILVWNTRSGMANAMVVGVLPWLRYVVLTDRLIAEMTPEEVEAVFGHEVGHVKHRHMTYYMTFLTVSLFVVWTGGAWLLHLNAVRDALDVVVARFSNAERVQDLLNLTTHRDLSMLPVVALLGAYIFVVFGFVSRRCERQADVYGCRTVSCGDPSCRAHDPGVGYSIAAAGLCATGIRTFISALDKVAVLNGISRDKPGWLRSWQHSTIASRIDFLQRVLADRSVEKHFQRRVRLIKWALFLGMAVLLAIFSIAWQKQSGDEGAENNAALQATASKAFDEALVKPPHMAARTAPSE